MGAERTERPYLEAALKAEKWIAGTAVAGPGGIAWPADPKDPKSVNSTLYAGNPGVVLFYLELYVATGDKGYLKKACAGADFLIAGLPEEKTMGLYEGIAGIGCALRETFKASNDQKYQEASQECLKRIQKEARPVGKDLYYLGWCHGPVGTARLFYRLYRITNDAAWLDWVKRSANGVMESGIPEKQTPGFWNNAGICCGLAGVGDFFLSLYETTRDKKYLDFCKRTSGKLLASASGESKGLKWIQAEHRTRPELLVAQTGLMQGAAGIGLFLLHLDALGRGQHVKIILPDTPF